MGGLVGARFMGDGCQSGNPKACLGEAFPGFVWGVGIGTTLGAPLGAHLGNGRRGDLPRAVLVSSAFLAGEVVALRTFIEGDQIRPGRRRAVQAIVILTPIAQIVAAALVERQSAARR